MKNPQARAASAYELPRIVREGAPMYREKFYNASRGRVVSSSCWIHVVNRPDVGLMEPARPGVPITNRRNLDA